MKDHDVKLSAAQRQYLLIGHGVPAAVISSLVNGLIAWLVFRIDPVSTWGWDSAVAPDLIITGYCLPAITCLIVTPIVRAQVRSGVAEGIEGLPAHLGWLRWPYLIRCVLFGVLGLALVGGPLGGGLWIAGPDSFARWFVIGFKALFTAAFAFCVAPLIAWVALADTATHGDP